MKTRPEPPFAFWLNSPLRMLRLEKAVERELLASCNVQTVCDLLRLSPETLTFNGLSVQTVHYLQTVLSDQNLHLGMELPQGLKADEYFNRLCRPLYALNLNLRQYHGLYFADDLRIVADLTQYDGDGLRALTSKLTENDWLRIESRVLRLGLRFGVRILEPGQSEIRRKVLDRWPKNHNIRLSECGFRSNTMQKLNERGLKTVGDLTRLRLKTAHQMLGRSGYRNALQILTNLGLWFEHGI